MSADDRWRERATISGDLGQNLLEHLWGKYGGLHLAGEDFEVVGCEDVPGYESDDEAVFLRRKLDGIVFRADIEADVRRVQTPAQREYRLVEAAGQLRLPGVLS
jgi:hypothetical protein